MLQLSRDVAYHVDQIVQAAMAGRSPAVPAELQLAVEDGARQRLGTVRIHVTWASEPCPPAPAAVEVRRQLQPALTPRESEIAELLGDRLSNREIATHLAISEHTVRHHVERVLTKLGVESRKMVGRSRLVLEI